VAATAAAALLAAALAAAAAPEGPLYLASDSPEGLSWMLSLGAKPVYSTRDLEPGGLLIVLPGSRLPSDAIAGYAVNGTVLLLASPEIAGIPCTLGEGRVLDEIVKAWDRRVPLARGPLGSAALIEPPPLHCAGPTEAILETSPFSYLDLDGDGYYTPGEPLGPFTVAARLGNMVVSSSPSIVYNAVADYNRGLLLALAGGGPILVDQTPYSDPLHRALTAAARVPEAGVLAASLAAGAASYAVARRL